MADQSFLSWPFFSDAHRKIARELEAWIPRELLTLPRTSDEDSYSRQLVTTLGKGRECWLRYVVPDEYGGVAPKLDVRTLCLIRETLSRYSSLADFAFAMQGLGSAPLTLFGNAQQKKAFLPKVCIGQKIAAFALSERVAGSDVAALTTTAEKQGEEYLINGEKSWISNAGLADFYTVFARTGEAPGAKGLSCFVVDARSKGLEVTERFQVVSPHPLGTIRFNGCRVPVTNLIGPPGAGFQVAMATLDTFRSTVGAAALGFARSALDEALKRVLTRKVFGQLLAQQQMTQQKIADMATEIDASALLVYRAAWAKDSGAERITREAAMAKLYATESAQRVIDQAVQLLGAEGVIQGSRVEELYRDIRPLRIYEGTSEIQRIVIATQVLNFHARQNGLTIEERT